MKQLIFAYWWREDGTYAWTTLGLVDSSELDKWWEWAKENQENVANKLGVENVHISRRMVSEELPTFEDET